jgi:tetratricopeptide (TPR) repeat protein
LPPEEWGQLGPYLPHIQAVGDGLVEQIEAEGGLEDSALVARAMAFAENTTRYVYRRREEHREKWLEMGLATSRHLRRQEHESLFLNDLGLVYNALGERDRALEFYQQALPIHRTVGNRQMKAVTLNNIGMIYKALGEKDKALEFYQQALPLKRAVGDKQGEAYTLNNIGVLLWHQGERERGLALVEQALVLLEYVRSPNARIAAGTIAQWRAELGQQND